MNFQLKLFLSLVIVKLLQLNLSCYFPRKALLFIEVPFSMAFVAIKPYESPSLLVFPLIKAPFRFHQSKFGSVMCVNVNLGNALCSS